MYHKIQWFFQAVKDRLFPKKYTPDEYWQKRLSGNFNLIGVGNKRFTEEENLRLYEGKKAILLKILNDERVDLQTARVLEIGCGTGYWTEMCRSGGCKDYTGVDIAAVAIEKLKVQYSSYKFLCGDAGKLTIDSAHYSLILMIDVTQHIVDDTIFFTTMEKIRSVLDRNGIFVVTSWLDATKRDSYYEKSRDMSCYTKAFPGYKFSTPVPFSDKFLFTIRQVS